jgi:hypothetical protein
MPISGSLLEQKEGCLNRNQKYSWKGVESQNRSKEQLGRVAMAAMAVQLAVNALVAQFRSRQTACTTLS